MTTTTHPTMDCPSCSRMGRIVIEKAGSLTTRTCPNCNGQGVLMQHDTDACERCIYARAGYWEYFDSL